MKFEDFILDSDSDTKAEMASAFMWAFDDTELTDAVMNDLGVWAERQRGLTFDGCSIRVIRSHLNDVEEFVTLRKEILKEMLDWIEENA